MTKTQPRRRWHTAAVICLVCAVAAGVFYYGFVRGPWGLPGTGEGDPNVSSAHALDDMGEAGSRWHKHGWKEVSPDEEAGLTEEQRAEFARLRSIGYLTGSTPMPANSGVIVYDKARTHDGLNFYTSGHFPGAVLMDMTGEVLHEWMHDFVSAWSKSPGETPPESLKSAGYWRRAYLFENGDVLAVFEGLGLIKIDKDSNLLWAYYGACHHDLEVMDDGRIFVLTREARIVPRINPEHPILEDFITILDANGNEFRRVSVLEAFEDSWYSRLIEDMDDSGDIFHTNTIEVLDGRLADRLRAFREGNVLICLREVDVIAVVDMESERVVWGLEQPWSKQHQPTVLDNGNILIFDNRGYGGMSRVIEFDPVTLDVEWMYHGARPQDFFSNECGSNQRLPNGNTLITESDRGKALEVTPDRTIVWKFLNPAQTGDSGEYIATIFELVRLPQDFPTDWLESE